MIALHLPADLDVFDVVDARVLASRADRDEHREAAKAPQNPSVQAEET